MLNFIKHEEEFFGIFKLVNGEEVLAKAVLTKDHNESIVFLQDPLCVEIITNPISETKIARGMGFIKWQQLSDEDFYVIREKDILTISAMSKECIFMYESYLKGETTDSRNEKMEQEPSKHLGYLGSIDQARRLFEKIYINPSKE